MRVFSVFLFLLLSFNTYAVALPGEPTGTSCNGCSESEKSLKATNIANYVGQSIFIMDLSPSTTVTINEYVAIGHADNLTVSLVEIHSEGSTYSRQVTEAIDKISAAMDSIDSEVESGLNLGNEIIAGSAFEALLTNNQTLYSIQDLLNQASSTYNKELDVIEVSLEHMKDNFGVSIAVFSTSLSVSNSLVVRFRDNTTVEYAVSLDRDINAASYKIKIELKFKVARDASGKPIPLNIHELKNYKKGGSEQSITVSNHGWHN